MLIKFVARSQDVYDTETPPSPASNHVPEWFKNIPPERSSLGATFRKASTVKKCVPFLDAFTTGYMICAPQDLGVTQRGNDTFLDWGVERREPVYPDRVEEVIGVDSQDRTAGLPVPVGYKPFIFRINVYPRIETPTGYSVLITHPLNRYDLPFLTLSGIVDTDELHSMLVVNMYIKEDFNGIIKEGTPLAQVVPFKRENWEHKVSAPYDSSKAKKQHFGILRTLNRSYQTNYWSKKVYK